jgi:four helix bundle protein
MKIFSFEKLTIWQEAKELTKVIYTLTSSFPKNEKFGFVSQ